MRECRSSQSRRYRCRSFPRPAGPLTLLCAQLLYDRLGHLPTNSEDYHGQSFMDYQSHPQAPVHALLGRLISILNDFYPSDVEGNSKGEGVSYAEARELEGQKQVSVHGLQPQNVTAPTPASKSRSSCFCIRMHLKSRFPPNV